MAQTKSHSAALDTAEQAGHGRAGLADRRGGDPRSSVRRVCMLPPPSL